MPNVSNKQIAHAFREARPYVEDRRQKYICAAVNDAASAGKISVGVSDAATDIISDRMSHKLFLESWLYANSRSFAEWEDRADRDEQFEQMRLYRLRWLDALIEEFDKK